MKHELTRPLVGEEDEDKGPGAIIGHCYRCHLDGSTVGDECAGPAPGTSCWLAWRNCIEGIVIVSRESEETFRVRSTTKPPHEYIFFFSVLHHFARGCDFADLAPSRSDAPFASA